VTQAYELEESLHGRFIVRVDGKIAGAIEEALYGGWDVYNEDAKRFAHRKTKLAAARLLVNCATLDWRRESLANAEEAS